MGNSKKFFDGFLENPGPSRGIADITSVPEPEEDIPSAEEMIDALYTIMTRRLDEIESKIESILDYVKK
jgi:hypothetical protein